MQNNYLRKGLAICLVLMLVGIIPTIGAKTSSPTINKTIQKNPINKGVIFSDDFNDNLKDMTKWTEIYTGGEWYERNYQLEFKKYESSSDAKEGIESIAIPVTIKKVPLIVECIMDTFIDNYPDPFFQYIGRVLVRVVDADDPDNHFIEVFYRRDLDQIIVKDSSGTNMIIGGSDEFRFKVTITINKEGYVVDVGPYTSGLIPAIIFFEKFNVKIRLYQFLSGDYSNYWWIGGFDDVVMTGKRSDPRTLESNIPRDIGALQRLILKFLENRPFLRHLTGIFN
jgi:hypothetical protein